MPIVYDLRAVVRTVAIAYEGRVTEPEYHAAYVRLYTDPAYRSGYSELVDCRGVTAFDVSVQAIRNVGEMAVVAAGTPPAPARVAIVAGDDVMYGLSRLYQTSQEPTSEVVEVFRNLAEARRWLGLEPEREARAAPLPDSRPQ